MDSHSDRFLNRNINWIFMGVEMVYANKRIKLSISTGERQQWLCAICGKPIHARRFAFPEVAYWGNRDGSMSNLHHKDGDHSNNSDDNLQLLCIDCHTMIHRRDKKPQITIDQFINRQKSRKLYHGEE